MQINRLDTPYIYPPKYPDLRLYLQIDSHLTYIPHSIQTINYVDKQTHTIHISPKIFRPQIMQIDSSHLTFIPQNIQTLDYVDRQTHISHIYFPKYPDCRLCKQIDSHLTCIPHFIQTINYLDNQAQTLHITPEISRPQIIQITRLTHRIYPSKYPDHKLCRQIAHTLHISLAISRPQIMQIDKLTSHIAPEISTHQSMQIDRLTPHINFDT